MLKLHYLFCLLMCLPAWARAQPRYQRFDLPVALSGGATATVEIAWPSGRLPRALVVAVPNSGGLSDPYFNPELEKPVYDPDRRGGLTDALLAAGYAVAFYNQRGFAPLRSCISGADFHARAISFVVHCIDPAIRAGVTLSTITADTASVFAALETHPRTRGLRQIALPYSEGMHHVSALVGRGAIHPIGIVSVGGPHLAMGELVRYQAQHEFSPASRPRRSRTAPTAR